MPALVMISKSMFACGLPTTSAPGWFKNIWCQEQYHIQQEELWT
jgi:hypothetical protein